MMGDVNPYASQPRPRHAAWMDKRTLSNAGHSPVNCRRPVRPRKLRKVSGTQPRDFLSASGASGGVRSVQVSPVNR